MANSNTSSGGTPAKRRLAQVDIPRANLRLYNGGGRVLSYASVLHSYLKQIFILRCPKCKGDSIYRPTGYQQSGEAGAYHCRDCDFMGGVNVAWRMFVNEETYRNYVKAPYLRCSSCKTYAHYDEFRTPISGTMPKKYMSCPICGEDLSFDQDSRVLQYKG